MLGGNSLLAGVVFLKLEMVVNVWEGMCLSVLSIILSKR